MISASAPPRAAVRARSAVTAGDHRGGLLGHPAGTEGLGERDPGGEGAGETVVAAGSELQAGGVHRGGHGGRGGVRSGGGAGLPVEQQVFQTRQARPRGGGRGGAEDCAGGGPGQADQEFAASHRVLTLFTVRLCGHPSSAEEAVRGVRELDRPVVSGRESEQVRRDVQGGSGPLEEDDVAHGLFTAFHAGDGGRGVVDGRSQLALGEVGRAAGQPDDRPRVTSGDGVLHGDRAPDRVCGVHGPHSPCLRRGCPHLPC